MNKTLKMWMMAAIFILCGACMSSCGNKNAKQNETKEEASAQTEAEVAEVKEEATCLTADFVKKYNLPVKMVQDYGWPAVALPE